MRVAGEHVSPWSLGPIPARAGVGLKPDHYQAILEHKPDIGWLEVHPENYMGDGGPPHHYLTRIREDYPLSLHGVGASIGSDGPLDTTHLERLKALVERYEPGLLSEHLAWSTHDDIFYNDLLPVPYTSECQARVIEHVDRIQDVTGMRMLLENPSTYVAYEQSDMDEIDFLKGIVERAGCGLLLDVNNVHVSATNHDFDADAYIDAFPVEHVGEIHLAGFAETRDETGAPVLIDAHDRAVAERVWGLYERAIRRAGPAPTLIEWDNDIPAWSTLFDQARMAETILHARGTNHVAAE